jgi:hypothetical protein
MSDLYEYVTILCSNTEVKYSDREISADLYSLDNMLSHTHTDKLFDTESVIIKSNFDIPHPHS